MKSNAKRLLCLVLCLATVLCLMPWTGVSAASVGSPKYGSGFKTNVTLTGNGATDIVTVAKAQKYMTKKELGYSSAWCDAFVIDCARIAGISTSVIPNQRGCYYLYNKLISSSYGAKVVSKANAQAGDLVFYYCSTCKTYCHVGIYVGGGYTCEGNVGNPSTVSYSNRNSVYYQDTSGHTSKSTVKMIFVRPNYANNPIVSSTYTVKYDANGGSGTAMANTTVTYGTATNLRANTYTYSGMYFGGWNAQRASDSKWFYTNGTTTGWYLEGTEPSGYVKYTYGDKASVSKTSSVDKDVVTFYAVWSAKSTEINLYYHNWYPSKLVKGSAFTVGGTVSSDYALTNVTLSVTDSSGKSKFSASANPGTNTYEIYNLDSKMKFSGLAAGTYTYKISASNAAGVSKTLFSQTFTVKASFSSSTSGLKYPTSIVYGNDFTVGGTMSNSATIATLGASISTTGGRVLQRVTVNPNSKTYNISNLNSKLDFSVLPVGTYIYRLISVDSSGYGYCTVTYHFDVTKAATAPNKPGSTLEVDFLNEHVTNDMLPAGWVWDAEDLEATLIPGDPAKMTALYNGADKGNYTTESVTITVTREDCLHAITEVLDAFNATFTETGYTGDLCCSDCGLVLQEGTVLPSPECDHPETTVTGKIDATAATDGYTGDTYCTICEQLVSSGSVIPATGSKLSFTDVAVSDYFYEPVAWAVEQGVTTGLTATTFGPGNTCTRGQVVTFLWRSAGQPEPATQYNPFSDVKETDYFYKAILWAVEEGITNGYGTTFGAEDYCTRGQVVTFLWRSAGQPKATGENPFSDVNDTQYYYASILWAVEQGITTGLTETTFGPDTDCTRGQVVTFLYRANN